MSGLIYLCTAFPRQVAIADTILLNKSDLADEDKLKATEAAICSVNPTAPIQRSVRGVVDLATIIGINAYASRPTLALERQPSRHSDERAQGDEDGRALDQHQHQHQHQQHDHVNHTHTREITSTVIPIPTLAPSQVQRLDGWIRSVLWDGRLPNVPVDDDSESKLKILRCKGIYKLLDGKGFIIQGVETLYEVQELGSIGDDIQGKLVLIGRGLSDVVASHLSQYIR
jgi:G3E family GTPase